MEQGPPDAIFGLVEAFKKDPRPEKVSLVIGAYRDGAGQPFVLPTVKKVCIIYSYTCTCTCIPGPAKKLSIITYSKSNHTIL